MSKKTKGLRKEAKKEKKAIKQARKEDKKVDTSSVPLKSPFSTWIEQRDSAVAVMPPLNQSAERATARH